MDEGTKKLFEHLRNFSSLPILFVGSGLSIRYLGLSNWEDLLTNTAKFTGKDFGYYYSSADGSLPGVASAIADDFQDVWWTDNAFSQSREQHKGERLGRTTPYKIEVANFIQSSAQTLHDGGQYAEEIELFRNSQIDALITTNYDRLLEELFPDYVTYIGQDQLLFADPQGIGEIYKIHGCTSQPDSLVITHDDYRDFHERNPYLAAKLVTLFVEHPVIFIGYSLTDSNIRELLSSISGVLTQSNIRKLEDRLIFVKRDKSLTESTFVSAPRVMGSTSIPTHQYAAQDFLGLFSALTALERKFPVRVLRHLKESVYRLVLENDPSDQLGVLDIDAIDDHQDIDVVIGVGAKEGVGIVGYGGVGREDLLMDLIEENFSFQPEMIVRRTLPELCNRSGNTPIHKYIWMAGYTDENGNPTNTGSLPIKVQAKYSRPLDDFQSTSSEWEPNSKRFEEVDYDLDRAMERYGPVRTVAMAALAPPGKLDINKVKELLEATKDQALGPDGSRTGLKSKWAKLVCFYDFVIYGPPNPYRRGAIDQERRSPEMTSW